MAKNKKINLIFRNLGQKFFLCLSFFKNFFTHNVALLTSYPYIIYIMYPLSLYPHQNTTHT